MGRKPVATLDCPRGVSTREFAHERRLQIAFSFQGQECRELLPPGTITKSAIAYADSLRGEIRRKIKAGTFVYAEYFPDSPRASLASKGGHKLIGDLLQDQLKIYERQVENKQLSPSTLDGYKKAINSERMKFWHGRKLEDATPSELRSWISSLDVTAKFARNLMTPLRSVFEDSLNDGLIEFDPFERVALTKLLKQVSTASEYEVDPFTADERATLIRAARPDERSLVQFWFNTGLRPGELLALRWPKIDLAKALARIDVNLVAKTEKGPKTEAGIRDVDLNEDALEALAWQKAASFLAGEHVFLNPRTGKSWQTDAQLRKTLWIPLCSRAGIRYRNPYQVRHTFASALLTAGGNPWHVANLLGHVDVTMVFQTYGKFISEDFKKPTTPKLKVVG